MDWAEDRSWIAAYTECKYQQLQQDCKTEDWHRYETVQQMCFLLRTLCIVGYAEVSGSQFNWSFFLLISRNLIRAWVSFGCCISDYKKSSPGAVSGTTVAVDISAALRYFIDVNV